MQVGPLFEKLRSCTKKIIVVQGGGDAGKTVTILQDIATRLAENPGWIATVTAQDGPNLTGGALRAFQRYVYSDPEVSTHIRQFNKQEKTYYWKNGAILEFKSFDDELDARGSERDILFMNECNSRSYQFFWQLQRKTRHKCYLDYNPTSHFWVHEKILPGDHQEKAFINNHQFFRLDHRHNPFLTAEEHQAYEDIGDPDLFRVYARGLTGKVKGLIFGHFREVQALPAIFDRIIWGIDYGYTNDPTVLMKVYCWGRHRYAQEILYKPGDVTPQELKDALLSNGFEPGQMIYSEADPNMINQLRLLGMPIFPAIKGPGSRIAGISKVRQYECFYYQSPHFKGELGSWKWVEAVDQATGKEIITNQPMDGNDHACDATRFAIYSDSFKHR